MVYLPAFRLRKSSNAENGSGTSSLLPMEDARYKKIFRTLSLHLILRFLLAKVFPFFFVSGRKNGRQERNRYQYNKERFQLDIPPVFPSLNPIIAHFTERCTYFQFLNVSASSGSTGSKPSFPISVFRRHPMSSRSE